MKWGEHNVKAEQRVNAVFSKFVGSRVFFMLVALASLVLISGAHSKWTGN